MEETHEKFVFEADALLRRLCLGCGASRRDRYHRHVDRAWGRYDEGRYRAWALPGNAGRPRLK